MYIKKEPYSQNEYIYAGGVWVRNFTKPNATPVLLDSLHSKSDYHTVLLNEIKNSNFPNILEEKINFSKIVIVSDGYAFTSRHKIIANFPADVAVFAINKALKEWKLISEEVSRPINAYIVNNPYSDCVSYLPTISKYYPACVASRRTNYSFLSKYQGTVYTYAPTSDYEFGQNSNNENYIDDYRNPICAAIDLAYRFGVEKLMLLCCDNSFKNKKDASVVLDNGLYTYPQHLRLQEIIDAKLYWLVHQESKEVKVCDFSEGNKYNNASYINNEQEAIEFFI